MTISLFPPVRVRGRQGLQVVQRALQVQVRVIVEAVQVQEDRFLPLLRDRLRVVNLLLVSGKPLLRVV